MKSGQIGHYEIMDELGKGGMGIVYKARDLNLDRRVAIKLLRAERIGEAERKRFAQEARAASALNHPNIVHIYDIGSEAGADFIVMEFVDGVSLDQLIAQRRLDLTNVLRYSIQIAGALAKAHSAGIVHRDLKPSNLIVASDGTVKILDFGLAKLLSPPAGELQSTHTLLHEPMRTEQGVIMGTVAYMAPEQAEGDAIDARADIFSFGAVLYEMITGQRAFTGKSQVSVLSAVMTKEPPPIGSQANVPRDLEKIVERCLRKDPDRRYQHLADVRVALEEVKAERESGATAAPQPAGPRRLGVLALAAAAIVSALLTATGSWLYWRPAPAKRGLILNRLTADDGLTTNPALSADGKLIAYASDRAGDGAMDIWVQQLASGEAIRLTNDPADDSEPYFSPDGSRIIFRSEREGGGIYTVPALGGESRLVVPEGHDPRYSPDGQMIAYWTGYSGSAVPPRAWILSLDGRTKRELNTGGRAFRNPTWSPDGKYLLLAGGATGDRTSQSPTFDWWITAADGSQSIKTGAAPFFQQQGLSRFFWATWAAPDHLVFTADSGDATEIWRAPVSRPGFQFGSPAERVTTGTGQAVKPSAVRDLIAFAAENADDVIWSLKLTPDRSGTTTGLDRLTSGTSRNSRPSLSRDGSVMAYLSIRSGRSHIRIQNRSGSDRALTDGSRPQYWPVLSPDGARVAFSEIRYATAAERQAGIPVLIADTRTGVAQIACADCYRPEDWSPDGNRILIVLPLQGETELAEFDLAAKQRRPLIKVPKRRLVSGRYSPDGRWLSFNELGRSDTRQVWLAPLDGETPVPPERWVAITDGAAIDREARWAPDGGTLYFTSNRDGFTCIWAQRLDPATKRPTGPPVGLRHFHTAKLGFNLGDAGLFGLSIGGNRMVISLGQTTGNIWLMRQP